MLSVNFSGNSIQEVIKEIQQFTSLISGSLVVGQDSSQIATNLWDGYLPDGIGRAEYTPVDDGREWGTEALREWIENLRSDGRQVVGILAQNQIIDPRVEAAQLGWSGTRWAGVWTGPRRQAGYVQESRGLTSWPYGHTYEEPRRLWMHPDIASRVLNILNNPQM